MYSVIVGFDSLFSCQKLIGELADKYGITPVEAWKDGLVNYAEYYCSKKTEKIIDKVTKDHRVYSNF